MEFMEKVEIPSFSDEHKHSLDSNFTLEELKETISRMKLGEPPGLEVLLLKFYRAFTKEILPYLQELFSYCLSYGVVLASWREAKIVLLDIRYPEVYRPVSILNPDYKILVTLLANRLSNIVGTYVNSDQMGFIPGRKLKDDMKG